MKIYTKTGDDGTTALFGGQRVAKNDLRIECYGTVDELNSILGLAFFKVKSAEILKVINQIQNDLFILGADLATPSDKKNAKVLRIDSDNIKNLEKIIDNFSGQIPELRSFILPGGTEGSAYLHIARTICRRAERLAVSLSNSVDIGTDIVIYLNRLSDLFFILARFENHSCGFPDKEWKNIRG